MIVKTPALILKNIKYGDYDIISKIYTQSNGIQSFIFKGVRKPSKKKNKKNLSLLQPLELDFKLNEKQQLRYCKDFKMQKPLLSLLTDMSKQAVSLYIADLLNECIKEEQADEELFDFIWHSVLYLDEMEQGTANFHLAFTVKLMPFLGIYPVENALVSNKYYDYQHNEWIIREPVHPNFFTPQQLYIMEQLNTLSYNENRQVLTSRTERNTFLQQLLRYYRFQMEGMRNLKSIEVLEEVFD